MEGKTLKLLLIIFVVLIVIAAYPTLRGLPLFSGSAKESPVALTGFTSRDTQKISIHQGDLDVLLQKEGSLWKTASYAASLEKMNELFSVFGQTTDTVVVSTNPSREGEYGLATSSSYLLILEGKAEEKKIEVGKSGPGSSFYAKLQGDTSVYDVQGDLVSVLSPRENDWREKTILQISSGDVTSVVFIDGTVKKTMQNKNGSWQLSESSGSPQNVDVSKAQAAVSSLSNLNATDFYSEAAAKEKMSTSAKTITLTDKNGKTLGEVTVWSDGTDYVVKKKDGNDIYKVPGVALEDVLSPFQSQ